MWPKRRKTKFMFSKLSAFKFWDRGETSALHQAIVLRFIDTGSTG